MVKYLSPRRAPLLLFILLGAKMLFTPITWEAIVLLLLMGILSIGYEVLYDRGSSVHKTLEASAKKLEDVEDVKKQVSEMKDIISNLRSAIGLKR